MLRWLYPNYCEQCGELSERSICDVCRAKLPRLPRPICLFCGAPLSATPESTESCPVCHGKPRPFTIARSALQRTPETLELIHKLKYRHAAYLATGLAPLLEELWHSTPEMADFRHAALVPVPITYHHLSERGYNQAEELARGLSKLLRLPLHHALQRIPTEFDSQTRLSAAQRHRNACRAFCAAKAYENGSRTLPSHVVLVDDVYTTGSTARACCRALRRLPGVKSVAVLTVVRA